MYYVYVLQSNQDKRFYTGFTRDLIKRIEEHNSGISTATKGRIPLKLVYQNMPEYPPALLGG